MGWTPFSVPDLEAIGKFKDYRADVPGNSETWAWVQALSKFKYFVVHHTAGSPDETPDSIANYHINHNGWGGIGYHFVITKDGVVWYVGDVSTGRANVADMNDLCIGAVMAGDFTNSHPTQEQLHSMHLLAKQFAEVDTRFIGITGWESVKKHRDLQATACPGNTVDQWWNAIIHGVTQPPQEDWIAGVVKSHIDPSLTELIKLKILGSEWLTKPVSEKIKVLSDQSVMQAKFAISYKDMSDKYKGDLDTALFEKDQIQKEKTALETLNSQQNTKIKDLQEEVERKDQTVTAIKKEYDEFKTNTAQSHQKLTETIRKVESERDGFKKDYEDSQGQLKLCGESLGECENKIDELSESLDALKPIKDQLDVALAANKKLTETILEAEKQVSGLREALETRYWYIRIFKYLQLGGDHSGSTNN